MRKKIIVAANVFVLSALSQPMAAQNSDAPLYKDPRATIERRVNDLVSRMTLEEKVSQLGHTADAIPRLGIPEYNWWNEGLHGVARAGVATVFPQTIGAAATFDEPLIHRAADVISTEFRANYLRSLRADGSSDWYRGLTVWSPNINIFRDPRWGRGQETYGEDPFLTSRLGSAFITGLQGSDSRYLKTLATSKHFAVHSGPESTRHNADIHPTPHDLEDTYLPAFRATITEAKAGSVMCAYNSLNGQPACANSKLLEDRLRRDWKFQGYVVSDCGAVNDVFAGHHFATSLGEAVVASLKAGTDLICGNPSTRVGEDRQAALMAVQQGLLHEAILDRAMRRLFTARFRLGLFDPPSLVPFSKTSASEIDTDQHRQLALQVSRESLVLLKNKDNILPLKDSYGSIAVIGPDADSVDALVGNYNGTPSNPVTLLAGIRTRFPRSKVSYAAGSALVASAVAPDSALLQEALDIAGSADIVILALGLSPNIEGEEMKVDAEGFAGGDRTSLDLPRPQQELLKAIHALGKPIVLVLMNGSALAVNWADENVPAILESWYPGGQGGTAIAEAIAGDFSPAGRLPVTFYKSAQQLPAFDDYSMANRTYRYFSGEPLYPFGYGLSFTSFAYSHPKVHPEKVAANGSVTISVEVVNTGKISGDEVVQLYLTHTGVAGAPLRALQGFQRIHLDPAAKKVVSFTLRDRALSIVDESGKRRIVPGDVDVWIGGGQPVELVRLPQPPGAHTSFTITSDAVLPE